MTVPMRARVLGVIPARMTSTRLPGKVLREIAGKPMVCWVYENARRSPLLDDLVVATDSPEVQAACAAWAIPVIMTDEHPTGTDRMHEVMHRTDAEIYVNIQGDEPTVRPDQIDLLLQPLFDNPVFGVSTLKVRIDAATALDPNVVKVVTAEDGRALYFSRCPIPYDRNHSQVPYFKHIGLYAYRRAALAQFHDLPQSTLELAESLEQLRLLQNGIVLHVAETPYDTVGVDTEEDLQRVIALFAQSF